MFATEGLEQRMELSEGESSLGLPANTVHLLDHQPGWHQAFSREKQVLLRALEGGDVVIEHIGSTAVCGLKAKPMIDIAIGVQSFDSVPDMVGPLEDIGYTYEGCKVIPQHHVFSKGNHCSHIIHVVEYRQKRWNELLTFRDELRRSMLYVRAYEELKIELAQRFREDRCAYREAKAAFIQQVLANGRADAEG